MKVTDTKGFEINKPESGEPNSTKVETEEKDSKREENPGEGYLIEYHTRGMFK